MNVDDVISELIVADSEYDVVVRSSILDSFIDGVEYDGISIDVSHADRKVYVNV